jgi:hypothetical protein
MATLGVIPLLSDMFWVKPRGKPTLPSPAGERSGLSSVASAPGNCHKIRARLLHLCDGRKRRLTPAVEALSTYGSQAITTQQTMKTRLANSSLILALAVCGILSFAGCASMETDNTKSLLSEAGFRTRTPQTAKQKELYAALPSNKVERASVKGKVFYVFKDEKAGVAYVGGEAEHQRYQQLSTQRHVAQAAEEEMNPSLATRWNNQWGARREP